MQRLLWMAQITWLYRHSRCLGLYLLAFAESFEL